MISCFTAVWRVFVSRAPIAYIYARLPILHINYTAAAAAVEPRQGSIREINFFSLSSSALLSKRPEQLQSNQKCFHLACRDSTVYILTGSTTDYCCKLKRAREFQTSHSPADLSNLLERSGCRLLLITFSKAQLYKFLFRASRAARVYII